MREELAALMHEIWVGWTRFVLCCCVGNTIPAQAVRRWSRQMAASYDELSEEEKDSGRREADKVLVLLLDYPREELESALIDEDNRMYALRKKGERK